MLHVLTRLILTTTLGSGDHCNLHCTDEETWGQKHAVTLPGYPPGQGQSQDSPALPLALFALVPGLARRTPSKWVFGVMTQEGSGFRLGSAFPLPLPHTESLPPRLQNESLRESLSLQRQLQVAMQSGQGGAQIWEPQVPTRTCQLFLARAFQAQPT